MQHYVPVLIKVIHNETSGNTKVMTHSFKFYILCKKLFKNLQTFTQLEGLHFLHINYVINTVLWVQQVYCSYIGTFFINIG